MRILLLVRPCRGGIATHVRTLVRGLKRLGQEVYVAGPDPALAEESDGYFFVPLAFRPLHMWRAAILLNAALGKLKPDVVHCHGALAALLRPHVLKNGAAWVYTVHNFAAGAALGSAWREAWLARGVERIIAVSQALAETLIRHGVPGGKVRIIPNGIEIRQALPAPLPRATEAPLIVTLGRLVPEKGMGYLLQAFARLRQSAWPSLKLVVAGEGIERPRLEHLAAKLAVAGAVEFPGFVNDPAQLLKTAYLFATSPVQEGMGLANLEAMALGRPVVSTRVGGIPEVVAHGETGILVEPRRPEQLAAAIHTLLSRPDLAARLGEAGARRARERFSASTMVESTCRVYEEAKRL